MSDNEMGPMRSMGVLDDLWDYDDPAKSEARFRLWIADLPPSVGDSARAEAQTQLARSQGLQRHFAEAHATLDSVESRLAEISERVQVRYLLERGRVFNSSRAPDQARPLFLAAWEQARAAGEDALAVDAAHMLAIVASGEETLTWNQRALDLAQSSPEPRAQRWQGSLYNNIGWSYFDAGRYADALVLFERALERRRMDGKEKEIVIAQWCIGRTLRALGRLDEALALQQSLLATTLEDGYVSEELGELLLTLGRTGEARPHFRRAADLLSRDIWLAEQEPERLARLRQLGAAAPDA
ncbi:MAG TPA: tetratricopeptide repeat protein [Ktedonobacterales bacterium]|nr:tetratricopeptide repeat protein [Ktedonobacterales bacterium]